MRGPPFSVQEAEVRGFYEANCTVERLLALNALDDEPSFRQRGLNPAGGEGVFVDAALRLAGFCGLQVFGTYLFDPVLQFVDEFRQFLAFAGVFNIR